MVFRHVFEISSDVIGSREIFMFQKGRQQGFFEEWRGEMINNNRH
jgi:hypothetical protein